MRRAQVAMQKMKAIQKSGAFDHRKKTEDLIREWRNKKNS